MIIKRKKEERRKKKQGLLPCGYQKAKDSTFCPNSLQLKEDYLPCGYQEAKDRQYILPQFSPKLKVLVLSLDITQHSGDTSSQN